MIAKKYRRLIDNQTVEAVQYGENGRWSSAAASDVTRFVLGIDVNSGVSVANEHMLDVVAPVRKSWKPPLIADIYVTDPLTAVQFQVELGSWITRVSSDRGLGPISIVDEDAFDAHYEEIPPEIPRTEFDELSDVIYGSFSTLEGDLYQALAESAAIAVLKAGWSRKER